MRYFSTKPRMKGDFSIMSGVVDLRAEIGSS
jgi:hypothetical protein